MIFLFIDFYTQYGELISSSGFNFWNLFNSFIGSILGFAGAYFLFYQTQKATSKRDALNRKQLFTDKYNYFIALLTKIPEILKTQSETYNQFSKEIEANKFKIHIPKFVIDTPFSRLIESKENEPFFHAFINNIPIDQRKKSIDEFERIYSHLDYKYQLLQQSFKSLEILRGRIRQSMENYKNSLREVEDYAGSLFINERLIDSNPNLMDEINQLFAIYFTQKNDYLTDLKFHYDNFLTPLKKICLKVDPIHETHELMTLVNKAEIAYSEIEFNSTSESDEFMEYSKDLMKDYDDFLKRVNALIL